MKTSGVETNFTQKLLVSFTIKAILKKMLLKRVSDWAPKHTCHQSAVRDVSTHDGEEKELKRVTRPENWHRVWFIHNTWVTMVVLHFTELRYTLLEYSCVFFAVLLICVIIFLHFRNDKETYISMSYKPGTSTLSPPFLLVPLLLISIIP